MTYGHASTIFTTLALSAACAQMESATAPVADMGSACYGLNTKIALRATSFSRTGDLLGFQARPSIVANSFNFDLSSLGSIAYAKIATNQGSRDLAMEFYEANGALANAVPLKRAVVLECANAKTVISYRIEFSAPHRVVESVLVTLSPEGTAIKIRSEIESTAYALFFIPTRRAALYEAIYSVE